MRDRYITRSVDAKPTSKKNERPEADGREENPEGRKSQLDYLLEEEPANDNQR